ncbi:M48 family metallopeptidase [Vibrio alginolyticus]|uniref:M48 family metallopeptidase n=1 Tax=Vibrio alginolyticus TaxID=663 RepID=UPI00215C26FD|nr:SprT family zinc-dependent metalloprotease [Vibrio alginolyticus]MCR9454035.1 M48 family metallopeptidase [Vibrio alginolyticus]MCR9463923.1 M48 family metallopeptidase [Vibrio alginolyticus]
MSSELSEVVEIAGISVQLNRKSIKNLHLSVLPPNGRVRLSVPHNTNEQAIRLAIINKLSWIKQQQADFAAQPRQSSREMVSGESHYLWGKRYRLDVVETSGKHRVTIRGNSKLELAVSKKTSVDNRLKLLNAFYRQHMQESLSKLLPYWEDRLGVTSNSIGIKKMKTKWGSCNIQAKRLWLNLELAKKPPECLEYILVHELVHLLERHHNERFRALMDKNMPDWRERRSLLNSLPLAYEDWSY